MKSAVHPVPLLFFLSVVALILAYQVFTWAGAIPFLVSTALFAAAIGWLIGRRWLMYPWQIGLLGAIPAALFLLWRFYTEQTVQDAAENVSLFIFHPLLVIITGHFGGLVGRWQALRARTGADGGGT
jgi:hypothetical protein